MAKSGPIAVGANTTSAMKRTNESMVMGVFPRFSN